MLVASLSSLLKSRTALQLSHHPAESCRGATISRFRCGYAALWDLTPVLSGRSAEAGQVGRQIRPRAASQAGTRDFGCGYATLCSRTYWWCSTLSILLPPRHNGDAVSPPERGADRRPPVGSENSRRPFRPPASQLSNLLCHVVPRPDAVAPCKFLAPDTRSGQTAGEPEIFALPGISEAG